VTFSQVKETSTTINATMTVASGVTTGPNLPITVTNGGSGGNGSGTGNVLSIGVPSAPVSVTASPGSASATVTFSPPVSNAGSAVTSYTVTAADSTTPGNGGQTQSGSASPIIVGGLTVGDSYTFTVTATNGVGTGPPSAPSNTVVPTP